MKAVKMYEKALNSFTKEHKKDFSFEMRYIDPGLVSYTYSQKAVSDHLRDIIFIAKPSDKTIKNIIERYTTVYQFNEIESRYLKVVMKLGYISWHEEWGQEIITTYIKDDNSMAYYQMYELENLGGLDNNVVYRIAKKMRLESIKHIELTKMFSNKEIKIDNDKLKNEILETVFKTEFTKIMKLNIISSLEKELINNYGDAPFSLFARLTNMNNFIGK